MNSKIIYGICLTLCAVGAGFYITAYFQKDSLTTTSNGIDKQIKSLKSSITNPDIETRLALLEYYQNIVNANVEESKKAYNFFKDYNDNLNKYYSTLGDKKQWGNYNGIKTPTSAQFVIEYRKAIKDLTVTYAKHLLDPAPQSEDKYNHKVSTTFTFKENPVSPLAKWEDRRAPLADILPTMRKFNIAKALCTSASQVPGEFKITRISVKNLTKDEDSDKDFDTIDATIVCQLPQTKILTLVNKILTNDKILFSINKYKMFLPKQTDDYGTSNVYEPEIKKEKVDPNLMAIELELKVLMIKDDIAKKRTAPVTIVIQED